jgi:hypothetical protein
MKKIYTAVAVLAVATAATAQTSNRTNGQPAAGQPMPSQTPRVIHLPPPAAQAQGDTVFVFDGYYVYDWNSTLPGTFTIATEDLDGAQVASQMQSSAFGPTSDFVFFFEENPISNLHYAHPDSVFFAGACSWFNPLGQADNWLEMGPITLPAAGATLWWRHNMPDGNYRDGYKIKVSTTGMANYTDFTDAPVFTLGDNAASSAGDTINTPYNVFAQRSADISAYAGQDVYIAVHHDANDMFILYLTDFVITEGPASAPAFENNDITISQNMPNPANGSTAILYTLAGNTDVVFNVTDVTGKVVYTENIMNQSAGAHRLDVNTANLANGMYFYTFLVNGQTITHKMVVENK